MPIAGTDQAGDRLEHFRKAVKEYGLSGIIEFRGLMPSKEALGIGVPAISTRLTGIPELIEDDVNGLLTTPGDHEELADAIEKLLTDPDLAEALASRGREKVLKDFSVDRYTDNLIEAWTDLLT